MRARWFGSFDFAPIKVLRAVGAKANVPNSVGKKFSKMRSGGFFFVFIVAMLSSYRKVVPLFGCLSVSFFVAVGVRLLRKCLRRTVVFQHWA